MFDLKNRVAIVTGGNGGIGLGMAKGLAKAGANIAIFGRNPEKNSVAVDTIKPLGVEAAAYEVDVTDAAAIQRNVAAAANRFGRIDILINNAGMAVAKQPEDHTLEDWRTVMDTNVTSAFVCSNACRPEFIKAGGGKILNCGSMYSLFGSPFALAYAASKGAMVQLTKSLAVAWAPQNIQVNCFLPGWINTDMTDMAREVVPGLHESIVARTPAGRWGEPEDLEGIAVFLASKASDFITGTVIPVDGGYAVSG